MNNKEKLIKFINDVNKASFSQCPRKYFIENDLEEFSNLLEGNVKENILRFILEDKFCIICNEKITTLFPGWKAGYTLTCSKKCRNNHRSNLQKGSNNTSHRMSPETKLLSNKKTSESLKKKILSGEYTPKSNNYRTHGMIEFRHKNNIKKVRSLWELIFWIKNPDLEYEKIRILYYDNNIKRNRVYITDFYDKITNTIYEVKPKKYHYTLTDKKIAVLKEGYNYEIIDENDLSIYKTLDTRLELEKLVVNYERFKSRFKWFPKN